MKSLASAGAALLGGELRRTHSLAGGCLSQIEHIYLADGREAIVKSGPAPQTEAAMPKAIAASGARRGRCCSLNGEVLVLEVVPAGRLAERGVGRLGFGGREASFAKGQSYGWPEDYAFGPIPIANAQAGSWPLFWAERRLLPHCGPTLQLWPGAWRRSPRNLPNPLPGAPIARLASRRPVGREHPCRERQSKRAHRPGLLLRGMPRWISRCLSCSNSPSPPSFEAYGALEPGYRERLVIYRLWPALVHLRLFGDTYRPLVLRLLAEAGA